MPKAGRVTDIGRASGRIRIGTVVEGSPDVFTNSRNALRKGDAIAASSLGQKRSSGRKLKEGSATVNINGKPAGRVDDAIRGGGSVATGSEDVFIGDDTWGSGMGEATPRARFVLSQVPGSTAHGYYKEPYKLYHNDSLVQEGLTDENGVIEYELDELKGSFLIEAVNRKWRLEVQGLAPADTDEGVRQRLEAFSYHCSDDVVTAPNDAPAEEIVMSLGWFQNVREEEKTTIATDRITNFLKALIP